MKTQTAKKAVVKIASEEQHDNLKNQRKTLKALQQTADKENIAGRSTVVKDQKLSDYEKVDAKRKKMVHKSIQTGEATVTAEDLTSEEPSEDYWRLLAEKRGAALDDSLQENDKLKEQIQSLKEENDICKEMLDESKHLVEVLQEMIEEQDSESKIEAAEEVKEDS